MTIDNPRSPLSEARGVVTVFCLRCGKPTSGPNIPTERENLQLKKILGIERHRGHIPADAVYSPMDIHLAIPVAASAPDQFGNVRLES